MITINVGIKMSKLPSDPVILRTLRIPLYLVGNQSLLRTRTTTTARILRIPSTEPNRLYFVATYLYRDYDGSYS